MTKKKHGELVPVREISELEMNVAQHLQKFSYQQRSLPYCLDYTELLMKRILSAVRDGRLDEELGVVGRFDFHMKDWGTFEHWVAQALHDDASIFIALRGTGKEE